MNIDPRDMLAGRRKQILVNRALDNLFRKWDQTKEARTGIHASSILAPDKGVHAFCYREQVLNMFFGTVDSGINSTYSLRLFYDGWVCHMGWQRLFKIGGVAREIEKTRIDQRWKLFYTPDAVIELELGAGFKKEMWVVEIKSKNQKNFDEHIDKNEPPEDAVRQAHLYMYLTGIHQAIVLIHNKNTSEFKAFLLEFDPDEVEKYIDRLDKLQQLFEIYEKQQMIPKKILPCVSQESARAKNCALADICFMKPQDRIQLQQSKEHIDAVQRTAQKNASLMHEDIE